MSEGRIPEETIEQARALDIHAVAQRYGFTGRAGATGEAVGACPGCGGSDRFSVNIRRNIWRCWQGSGDPIGGDAVALVQHVEQCSFPRAIEILIGDLSRLVPKAQPEPDPQEANAFREKERQRAYDLWREGLPILRAGLQVVGYLELRALDATLAMMPGAHCREHPDMPYWIQVDTGRSDPRGKPVLKWKVIHRGPAMLWPIVSPQGRFMGLHATWIDLTTPRGKAEIFDPATGEALPSKKVRGSQKGGRIVLRTSDSGLGAVGEGIESVLSWHVYDGRDAGLECAINLGNLAGKAERTFAHPTLRHARRDGREIPVRVPGPEPKQSADPATLWQPPASWQGLTLIGDGDSEPIATGAAMQRAEARLRRPDLAVLTDWPAAGHDFNSMRMKGLLR